MSDKKQAAREATQKALAKTGQDKRLEHFKRQLFLQEKSISAALPKHITPLRMMKVAVGAMQRNPKLLDCEVGSLVKAVVEASELGLEPNGALGHAYLVPYRNNKTNRHEAQLQIGYKGMIDLAMRSGRVKSITARVVRIGDVFEYAEGLEPKLRHVPNMRGADGKPDSPKNTICVYAVAQLVDGGTAHTVLTVSEVETRRAMNRQSGKSPWDDHWGAMAKKTAIRDLAKFLPQSPEVQRIAAVDELRDEREVLDVDFSLTDADEGPVAKEVNQETGEVYDCVFDASEREPGEEG